MQSPNRHADEFIGKFQYQVDLVGYYGFEILRINGNLAPVSSNFYQRAPDRGFG
jgi:hypothetical protein